MQKNNTDNMAITGALPLEVAMQMVLLLACDFALICFYRCRLTKLFLSFIYFSFPPKNANFRPLVLRAKWMDWSGPNLATT